MALLGEFAKAAGPTDINSFINSYNLEGCYLGPLHTQTQTLKFKGIRSYIGGAKISRVGCKWSRWGCGRELQRASPQTR
jgi:hypothetical protein